MGYGGSGSHYLIILHYMDCRFLLERSQKSFASLLAFLVFLPVVAPLFASAINFPNPPANSFVPTPLSIIALINRLFYFIWPIVVAAVIILFMYGGFQFLTARGDETKLSKARLSVMWGVIGVGVIILSFSIIYILEFF